MIVRRFAVRHLDADRRRQDGNAHTTAGIVMTKTTVQTAGSTEQVDHLGEDDHRDHPHQTLADRQADDDDQSRASSATAIFAQSSSTSAFPAVVAAISAAVAAFVEHARQAEAGFVQPGDGVICKLSRVLDYPERASDLWFGQSEPCLANLKDSA